MLVALACDMRDEGKTAQETYDYLMDARLRIQHCIVPNDLFYLKRAAACRRVRRVRHCAQYRLCSFSTPRES
ncbi:MAG: hypothetical protein ACLS4Z_01840 [Christensenellaceae bacterium]